METRNDKPAKEIRIGNIKANVWKNSSEHGPIYSVSFERVYKGQDGKWATSKFFRFEDLLLLAKVADHTHTSVHIAKSTDLMGR